MYADGSCHHSTTATTHHLTMATATVMVLRLYNGSDTRTFLRCIAVGLASILCTTPADPWSSKVCRSIMAITSGLDWRVDRLHALCEAWATFNWSSKILGRRTDARLMPRIWSRRRHLMQDAPVCVEATQNNDDNASMPSRCAIYFAPRDIDLSCIDGLCIVNYLVKIYTNSLLLALKWLESLFVKWCSSLIAPKYSAISRFEIILHVCTWPFPYPHQRIRAAFKLRFTWLSIDTL